MKPKWRVFRANWSGKWYATIPDYRLPRMFPTWEDAFNYAFWEASVDKRMNEVP